MKIFFDYQIFAAQKNGGISRLFCNLINQLKLQENTEVLLPIIKHENECLKDFNHIINPVIQPRKKLQNFLDFFDKNQNEKITNHLLSEGNFDVFHATYYSDYFLKYLGNKPFVTTIHDMTYELFPEFFSLKDKTAKLKYDLACKANKIIVVSHTTKKNLLKLTDIKEEKIVVVPLACGLDPSSVTAEKIVPEKYLLYVGTRTIYKNFYFMVYALAPLLKKNNDIKLICFGQPFNKKEIAFFENLGLRNNVKAISGDDHTLIQLYKNAEAFIAPSYCEGFYLPLLEAFACGCPTIASNIEPIPEVVGDAALYFDPKDNIAIRNSVERVLSDQSLRNDLIQKGFERNKLFSWQKNALETRKVYESLL